MDFTQERCFMANLTEEASSFFKQDRRDGNQPFQEAGGMENLLFTIPEVMISDMLRCLKEPIDIFGKWT